MFIGFIIGALGGLAAYRFHRRHGGCGHGHDGRWGGRGHWRGGGFGPGRWWHLLRSLDLSPGQRGAVRDLFGEVRESMHEVRWGARREVEPLVEALGQEQFDRARVEEIAARQTAAFERVKKQMVDAAERLHDILIPEQRAHLREILGQWSPAPASGQGPYRTA